jgi:hypothetical protein
MLCTMQCNALAVTLTLVGIATVICANVSTCNGLLSPTCTGLHIKCCLACAVILQPHTEHISIAATLMYTCTRLDVLMYSVGRLFPPSLTC